MLIDLLLLLLIAVVILIPFGVMEWVWSQFVSPIDGSLVVLSS
ncbi:MAG: hypothetical protein QXX95_04920 [Nitrososphaerales archaeon]